MLRAALLLVLAVFAGGAHAAMDCDAMFKKTEAMVASSKKMPVENKVKAYRMAASAHEMCKDGKEEMAMKMYWETEQYIRREQDSS